MVTVYENIDQRVKIITVEGITCTNKRIFPF